MHNYNSSPLLPRRPIAMHAISSQGATGAGDLPFAQTADTVKKNKPPAGSIAESNWGRWFAGLSGPLAPDRALLSVCLP
jgi:hypothetical protein